MRRRYRINEKQKAFDELMADSREFAEWLRDEYPQDCEEYAGKLGDLIMSMKDPDKVYRGMLSYTGDSVLSRRSQEYAESVYAISRMMSYAVSINVSMGIRS